MKTNVTASAVAVSNRCPACDHRVTAQRDVKPFKRPYLCDLHAQMWDQAWAAEIAKEKAARPLYEVVS